MMEMTIFENREFGNIRTVTINNEPWFVGKDICAALGYVDPNKAIAMHVDDEDKLNDKTSLSLGQRGGWFVNESGMYSLIFGSKLESAKRFKRWVTSEVLPSIRKTGSYGNTVQIDDIIEKIVPAITAEVAKIFIPYITPKPEKRTGVRRWYDDYINISKEMTFYMNEFRISDRQLAKMSGVGYGSVRRYRIGENNCPPAKAKLILDVLHSL